MEHKYDLILAKMTLSFDRVGFQSFIFYYVIILDTDLHNGILHSIEKTGIPPFCDNMDRTGECYAKWNKPGSERQIPYDLTYKWNLINKTNEQNRTRDMEIKNKLTVTRGEQKEDNRGKKGKSQVKEHG